MTDSQRRELLRLLAATVCFGAAAGIFRSTLNNYLADVHGLGAEARGWLEFPRELPGFLIVVVAGALLRACARRTWPPCAMVLTAVGAVGLGAPVADHGPWSCPGSHLVARRPHPLRRGRARSASSSPGRARGRRLGQLGGARNLGIAPRRGLGLRCSRSSAGDQLPASSTCWPRASRSAAGWLYLGCTSAGRRAAARRSSSGASTGSSMRSAPSSASASRSSSSSAPGCWSRCTASPWRRSRCSTSSRPRWASCCGPCSAR